MDSGGKKGPANRKSDKPKRKNKKRDHPFKPKGPRPFDPESKAAKVSLEEHIKQGSKTTDSGRNHQRKKLENGDALRKRINTIKHSFAVHQTNQKKGRTPEDNSRTAVLNDFKQQELDVLQAFGQGCLEENVALYRLLEIQFLSKMIGGPAFHRAGLEDAGRSAIEKFKNECSEAFAKENVVGG